MAVFTHYQQAVTVRKESWNTRILYRDPFGFSKNLTQSRQLLQKDLRAYLKTREGQEDNPLTRKQKRQVRRLAPRLAFFISLQVTHGMAWLDRDEEKLLRDWSRLDELLDERLRTRLNNLLNTIDRLREQRSSHKEGQFLAKWRTAWCKDETKRLKKIYGRTIDAFWSKQEEPKDTPSIIEDEKDALTRHDSWLKRWWLIGKLIHGFLELWPSKKKRRERIAYWEAKNFISKVKANEDVKGELEQQWCKIQKKSLCLSKASPLKPWYEEKQIMLPHIFYRLCAGKRDHSFAVYENVYACAEAQLQQLSDEAKQMVDGYWNNWLTDSLEPHFGKKEAKSLVSRFQIASSPLPKDKQADEAHREKVVKIKEYRDRIKYNELRIRLLSHFEVCLRSFAKNNTEFSKNALSGGILKADIELYYNEQEKKFMNIVAKSPIAFSPKDKRWLKSWLNRQFSNYMKKSRDSLIEQISASLAPRTAVSTLDWQTLNNRGAEVDETIHEAQIPLAEDLKEISGEPFGNLQSFTAEIEEKNSLLDDEEENDEIDVEPDIADAVNVSLEEKYNKVISIFNKLKNNLAVYKKQIETSKSEESIQAIFTEAKECYQSFQAQLHLKENHISDFRAEQFLQLIKKRWLSLEDAFNLKIREINSPVLPELDDNQVTEDSDAQQFSPLFSLGETQWHYQICCDWLGSKLYADFYEKGLWFKEKAQEYINEMITCKKQSLEAWQSEIESSKKLEAIKKEVSTNRRKMLASIHNDRLGDNSLFIKLRSIPEKEDLAKKLRSIIDEAYEFFNTALEVKISDYSLNQQQAYLNKAIEEERKWLKKHQSHAEYHDARMKTADVQLNELEQLRRKMIVSRQELKKRDELIAEKNQIIAENDQLIAEKIQLARQEQIQRLLVEQELAELKAQYVESEEEEAFRENNEGYSKVSDPAEVLVQVQTDDDLDGTLYPTPKPQTMFYSRPKI